jgi:hypothetical protein
MKVMVLESQIQSNSNPSNSLETNRTGRLTAKWLVVNDQLVCKWIIA